MSATITATVVAPTSPYTFSMVDDVTHMGGDFYEITGDSFRHMLWVAKIGNFACLNKSNTAYNKPGRWDIVLQGLLGETAVGKKYGFLPNFAVCLHTDGGFDGQIRTTSNIIKSADIKCAGFYNTKLLVQSVNEKGYPKNINADIYIGCKLHSWDFQDSVAIVEIVGWASQTWLKSLPDSEALTKNGKWLNKQIQHASLNPMENL